MSTEEIHDMIQNLDSGDPQVIYHIGAILERLNNKIGALEAQLDRAESTARSAANVASCLANGIQPD